ncbi:nucleotide excision repair endonuclease [Luteolibacter sp. GHJ8]|uniref:Nucleotide excision repair endonuclease n=1 Tax=Luteolibacter rhizosphaerae TaxID=2989719 RepID=A0ABT3FZV2_9BACT|nr:nucleotide excision repair endonuclease [Luteolibacter rhizosphaerae]MCW1913107.1 nucleotide excision repair endonuclease [Luteolibacter rhizosphaerae]
MPESPVITRSKQPGLFSLENVLTQRFGRDFFLNLPELPGVYFFTDRTDKLLYIGQSASLRGRLGSYRHVVEGRHPRRTLRLVARIHRIDWEICESPACAIARESELLLQHRPPFNRAGVWIGQPWWLDGGVVSGRLRLQVQRQQGEIGPLSPGFRHLFGVLARCVYRAACPDTPIHRYPCGLIRPSAPLSLSLVLPDPAWAWQTLASAARGDAADLLALLDAIPPAASLPEQEFWTDQRDQLQSYAAKATRVLLPPSALAPDPSLLPLELSL